MTIAGTKSIEAVSNKEINKYNISPCTQEEADTRIFIHIRELLNQFPRIKVVTIDSDVVIIALFVFFKLQREKNIDELWIEFGVGKIKRWIPKHRYAEALGENICNALPFFHAFIGSHTTSQFAGRGDKTAWRTWQALPDTTATFIRLSPLIDISETDKLVLERFVCVMYDRGSTFTNVNDC